MMMSDKPSAPHHGRPPIARGVSELPTLVHRLNNQLGIILANAELLESKLSDEAARTRAHQIVSSAIDAIGTARQIRMTSDATV